PNRLSAQIAKLVGRTRGIQCLPEQVVVQAGTDGALATILQLFDRNNDVLGMEEPGYATVHEVAQRQGFKMVPLPSDQGASALFESLNKYKPKIVFSTPSHQFPTGRLLSLDGRTRLLKWAEDNGAYIIEDDSCNEFRYATKPIPSLQSLDAYGRVIYMCNVSKVLSPSLRIAYLVLPPRMLERYWNLFNYAHPSISWLEQEVLARFIEQGYWDAHARKTAKGNHRRHDELLRCLTEFFGDNVSVSGTDTGMHLYVTVHNGMTQDELLASARAQGVSVYGTSRMWFSKPAPEDNVLIGFSSIAFEDIEPGVRALAQAWLS
ncbi:MAG: PLP-dependent aminotransferase family protein, partial [Eggerthellaceae bacterium]|nr:PLP-dependent aminotransferase family protein [Eggerthellaceae bacterium]